jgi:hypothetical protein
MRYAACGHLGLVVSWHMNLLAPFQWLWVSCCEPMQHTSHTQAALRRVAFQNVGASIKACTAIAELLPDAAALEQLHLFNNMSGDEGAAAIGSLLARAPAMTDFRMASSRVCAEGAIALAQGLSSGQSLSALTRELRTCARASSEQQQQTPLCASTRARTVEGCCL